MQREPMKLFWLGRILLIILAASCLFTMYGAALDRGFLPEEIPSEQKESLLERLDVQLFYEAPPAKPIECFAVSESEFVAIGITYDPYREEESGYHPNRFVGVYNAQGEFQYADGILGATDPDYPDGLKFYFFVTPPVDELPDDYHIEGEHLTLRQYELAFFLRDK